MYKLAGYNTEGTIRWHKDIEDKEIAKEMLDLKWAARKNSDVTMINLWDMETGLRVIGVMDLGESNKDTRRNIQRRVDELADALYTQQTQSYRNEDRDVGEILSEATALLRKASAMMSELNGSLDENELFWLNRKERRLA